MHSEKTLQGTSELPEKGLPKNIIHKMLKAKLQRDFTYSSGKILSSMCTSPYSLAKKIFQVYLEKNIGDPTLFPATAELEYEAIQMLGSLFSHSRAWGSIVSGGTEANILALWTARNLAKRDGGEVVVPVSAHYSFDKAADLLNLKLVKVKLNHRFQIDIRAAEEAITPRTVAIVGVAGTTGLGVVDAIPELSEIASEHNIYLHVDAAFGGFMLPWLEELGYEVPDFDFRLPAVSSITVDPHKMGLAPIPAGGILFKNAAMTKTISTKIPYLTAGKMGKPTLLGTRSGASATAVWALLKHLGKAGYRAVVKHCLKLTWKLTKEIKLIDGLNIVTEPTLNVIGIKSDTNHIQLIFQELRKRGWAVSLFPSFIRIVIMPHTKDSHIRSLLGDFKSILEKLPTQIAENH